MESGQPSANPLLERMPSERADRTMNRRWLCLRKACHGPRMWLPIPRCSARNQTGDLAKLLKHFCRSMEYPHILPPACEASSMSA